MTENATAPDPAVVLCTQAFDRIYVGMDVKLIEVWCVCEHADPDGWNDKTACGYVALPCRRERRTPTCEECLRALAKRDQKPAKASKR